MRDTQVQNRADTWSIYWKQIFTVIMTLRHSTIHSRTWMWMSARTWRHSVCLSPDTFPFSFPQTALPSYKKRKTSSICRWNKRNLRMSSGWAHRWWLHLDNRDKPTRLTFLVLHFGWLSCKSCSWQACWTCWLRWNRKYRIFFTFSIPFITIPLLQRDQQRYTRQNYNNVFIRVWKRSLKHYNNALNNV